MKNHMKKRSISLLLALVMILSLCAPVWASEKPSSDFEPYEEAKTAFGATALSIIEDAETRQYFEKHIADMQLKLLEVSTKTIYVEDCYDDNGQFSSRLLSKAEVEAINAYESIDRHRDAFARNTVNAVNASNARGQLTITFSKSIDAHYNYVLNAYAKWNTDNLSLEGSVHPYMGDDYISIRWGGDDEYLIATGANFAGKYTDNTSMPGYRELSDAYGGYCWSFNERTAVWGKVMDHASVVVVLDQTYNELQNRETGAMLSYVHTYESRSPSWSLGFNGSSFSGGVTLSNCNKQWTIAAHVSGIQF